VGIPGPGRDWTSYSKLIAHYQPHPLNVFNHLELTQKVSKVNVQGIVVPCERLTAPSRVRVKETESELPHSYSECCAKAVTTLLMNNTRVESVS
jgi:hypothetical protein